MNFEKNYLILAHDMTIASVPDLSESEAPPIDPGDALGAR